MKDSLVIPMKNKRRGVTLLELMMVVGIMTILLGSIIYYTRGSVETAAVVRAEADINHLTTLVKTYTYRSFNLQPPEELGSLVNKPKEVSDWEKLNKRKSKWAKLLSRKEELLDPWGRSYMYKSGKESKNYKRALGAASDGELRIPSGTMDYMGAFDIWSLGPDGTDTTGETYGINNWGAYEGDLPSELGS